MKEECGEKVSVKEVEAYFYNPKPGKDKKMRTLEEFADAIMKLMKDENCTAADVAAKTGLPLQLIQQIENKKVKYMLMSDFIRIVYGLGGSVKIEIVEFPD